MMRLFALLLALFLGLSSKSFAQNEEDHTLENDSLYNTAKDFSITAFPIAFFLPETGLAFGALGISIFNIGEKEKWRKSQVGIGLAYTLKNQILVFVPYELYFNDKWKTQGELGFYRYFYNYYGIGIDSPASNLEIYGANFPRIINTVSYRLTDEVFVGIRNKIDVFEIPTTGEVLSNDNPLGIEGGTVSTIGLSISYDSRDNIFYPSKGNFTELILEHGSAYSFSDFTFTGVSLIARKFVPIKKQHIIGLNLFTGTQFGNVPFFNYYFFAGRGYNDRRFIDRNNTLAQIEYRYPIYKRLTGVAFTSISTFSSTYLGQFNESWKPAFGIGLRFQLTKKEKSNLRLDFAKGVEDVQFYITIGEAF